MFSLWHASLRINPMPSRTIEQSHRPRVSDRTMCCHSSSGQSCGLLRFRKTMGAITTAKWNYRKEELILRFTHGDKADSFVRVLEPDDGKPSSPVLRGLSGRKAARLPGNLGTGPHTAGNASRGSPSQCYFFGFSFGKTWSSFLAGGPLNETTSSIAKRSTKTHESKG